jgi:hypothetical protein
MSYQPQPNSVAARVIACLSSRPDGSTLTSAELSRQIGVPSSAFGGVLTAALNAGLVHKRWHDSAGYRTICWALGPRVVPAAGLPAQDQELDHGEVVATTVREPEPPATAPADQVADEIKALLDAPDAVPQVPDGFACALLSDGRFYLELGDETMTLQVEHTRALLAYLKRMAMP